MASVSFLPVVNFKACQYSLSVFFHVGSISSVLFDVNGLFRERVWIATIKGTVIQVLFVSNLQLTNAS